MEIKRIVNINELTYVQKKDNFGRTRLSFIGLCTKCGRSFRKRKSGIKALLDRNSYWDVLCVICGHRKGGENHPNWRGGRFLDPKGYWYCNVPYGDICESVMKKNRTMLEHRYIMSHNLGRCLEEWEVVHHKNHDRGDNRLENLEIVTLQANISESLMYKRIKNLEKYVSILEKRIKELEKNDK